MDAFRPRRLLRAAAVAALGVLVATAAAGEDLLVIEGVEYRHAGGGTFVPEAGEDAADPIDLRAIHYAYAPERDPDVPRFTDVTLQGIVPDLRDAEGRSYALITLYSVEPPLEDLPSREEGVDRGMDLRDPSTSSSPPTPTTSVRS
jgi:hypothetical protein